MAYGVIRTDLMAGTDVAAYLRSVKYIVTDTPTEIENGCVVKLEGLMEGEREVWKAVAPSANTSIKDIAIIATPEIIYDERKKNLDDFINKAGNIARAYIPQTNDIFSVTAPALVIAEGFTPAVGNIVELVAGNKMQVVASATEGSTVIGNIIAIDVVGRYTYYVIKVA